MASSGDLIGDPRTEACAQRARALFAGADRDWSEIRARILARVRTWRHATGIWHSPGDPLLPELCGSARGKLTDDATKAVQSAGFDEAGQLIALREPDAQPNFEYLERSGAEWVHWMFSETADGAWHRVVAVSVGQWIEQGREYVEASCGGQGRGRKHVRYETPALLEMVVSGGTDTRCFSADLDAQGHPTRVRSGDTVLFTKKRGDLGRELARMQSLLIREIPKRVGSDHAGHELQAVCLSHGEMAELLPPAVIGLRTEDFAALPGDPGERWEPGPLWDLREPTHLDNPKLQELAHAILLHLDEPDAQRRIEAMLLEVARALNAEKWPKAVRRAKGFLVYPANVEDGDWKTPFAAVLEPATREALRSVGRLPDDL